MNKHSSLNQLVSINDPIQKFANCLSELYPIKNFYFIVYTPWVSSVEKRIGKVVKHEVGNNLTHFGETKWDFEKSLILNIANSNNSLEVTKKLLLHDEKSENSKLISVSSNDVKKWLADKISSIDPEEAIGLTSMCQDVNGDLFHIPMMDFSCPISDGNLLFIKNSLREIGFNSGIIANSGRSYHFYGEELYKLLDWIKFMGKCLLLSPYTDSRYIAHRLVAGRCILRITHSKTKPEIPIIVDLL